MAKKLEIKKTVIRKFNPKYKGETYSQTELYYGNIAWMNDGTIIRLSKSKYKEELDNFLNSPEGKLYDRPSDEEIEEAISACDSPHLKVADRSPFKNPSKFKKGLQNVFGDDLSGESINKPLQEESKDGKTKDEAIDVSTVIIKDSKSINFLRFTNLMLIIVVVVLVLGILDIIPLIPKVEHSYNVIGLKRNVEAGEIIKAEDLEMIEIPDSQFDAIADGTYINELGDVKINYGVLWANAKTVEGKLATKPLRKGEFLKMSDYTALEVGVNSVEFKMEDGTSVMLPIKATQDVESSAKLYAIVSSIEEDGSVTNQAISLGNLNFGSKSFKSFITDEDEAPEIEDEVEEVEAEQ